MQKARDAWHGHKLLKARAVHRSIEAMKAKLNLIEMVDKSG